jgi:hypothetical protein
MKLLELEKVLKDRNVFRTLDDLDLFLQRLPPNGASVHGIGNLRAIIIQQKILMSRKGLDSSTCFSDYSQKDRENYLSCIHGIVIAQDKWKYLI